MTSTGEVGDLGFLDNVKEAFKGAVSSQASRDAHAAERVRQADAAVDPVPSEAAVKLETYTVRTGDSLPEIGARFGVSHLEIAELNNIENPDLIFPGQVFRIPKN